MSGQTHPTTDQQPAAELAMLDPATLLTDHNIRPPRTDEPFADLVASIREHGVLVPIVATRDHQGIRVRYGHRRVLAAVHAERETVPVVVYTGALTDATAAEIDRILGQHAENTHRTGLTTGETVAAFGQLAALGVTPARIARRSKTPRRTVDAALAAAASKVASKAAERWNFLTLDDAAALAEFDDDPDAVKALVTARQGGGEHRPRRPAAPRPPRHRPRHRPPHRPAPRGPGRRDQRAAVRREGHPPAAAPAPRRRPLTPESRADCPGHAAYVKRSWGQEKAETVYVCVHPRLHGHTDLTRPTADAERPTTDQEKAERRRVRANNDAWRSAEKVRRAWLRGFLTGRTPPKGTAAYLTTVLLEDSHPLAKAAGNGHHRARDLFRLGHLTDKPHDADDRRGGKTLTDLLDSTTDARALVIALGLVIAAHEDAWTTDTWRRPSTADARYLTFLTTNGYNPSEVEQLILGAPFPTTGAEPEVDAEEADTDQ